LLSKEYGWETGHILKMPLSEIYWRLEFITKRKNSEREFKASLVGAKLEFKEGGGPPRREMALTVDQKEALKIALERAKKKKRSEYGDNFVND
jgi:hypothetical protein